MLIDDAKWLANTDAFYSAAIDGKGWYAALEKLAAATGSRTGELIGVGAETGLSFNVMTNVDPGFFPDFIATGGGDPAHNPRVAAGLAARPLQVLTEADFITRDEYQRHPHYQVMSRRWDFMHSCLTTLEHRDGLLVGLAVLRSEREGPIGPAQRRIFARMAPHVRAAVKMQMALEGQGAALVAGAFESLQIPVFVCDRSGSVQAMSPLAETLVAAGGHGLQLRQGRLQPADPVAAQALREAVSAVAHGVVVAGPPPLRTVVLRSAEPGARPLVLDVMGLPTRQFELSFSPRVLVLVRGGRGDDARRTAIVQSGFGLTAAEAEVALLLGRGRSAEEIAHVRGVSTGTVRAQIKSILAKLDMSRQIELVAWLGNL